MRAVAMTATLGRLAGYLTTLKCHAEGFCPGLSLLKSSSRCGEEHQVMGEHAEVTLALAGLVRLAPQRRVQQALVPAEGALGLPALAVDAPVPAALGLLAEAPGHLPPVARLRPLAPVAAPVQ